MAAAFWRAGSGRNGTPPLGRLLLPLDLWQQHVFLTIGAVHSGAAVEPPAVDEELLWCYKGGGQQAFQ